MEADDSARAVIERALARPVSDASRAMWGFTNRTDIVTLDAAASRCWGVTARWKSWTLGTSRAGLAQDVAPLPHLADQF